MAQTEHLPIYKTSYDFCLYRDVSFMASRAPTRTRSVLISGTARGGCWSCWCAPTRGGSKRRCSWRSRDGLAAFCPWTR